MNQPLPAPVPMAGTCEGGQQHEGQPELQTRHNLGPETHGKAISDLVTALKISSCGLSPAALNCRKQYPSWLLKMSLPSKKSRLSEGITMRWLTVISKSSENFMVGDTILPAIFLMLPSIPLTTPGRSSLICHPRALTRPLEMQV